MLPSKYWAIRLYAPGVTPRISNFPSRVCGAAKLRSEHIKSRGLSGSEHNHGSPRSCTHRVCHFASDTNGAYPHQLHIDIRDRTAGCYRNRNCR